MRPNLLGHPKRPPQSQASVGASAPVAPPTAAVGQIPQKNTKPRLLPLLILAGGVYAAYKYKKPSSEDALVDQTKRALAAGETKSVGWWAVAYETPESKHWKERFGPFATKPEAEAAADVVRKDYEGRVKVLWGGDDTGNMQALHAAKGYTREEIG